MVYAQFQTPIEGSREPDKRFLCQSSSLEFLISHGFDFNKLFKHGVSYLSYDEEAKLRANFEERQTRKTAPRNDAIPTRPNDIKYSSLFRQHACPSFFGLLVLKIRRGD